MNMMRDVVILGGGLAGLSLALQLKQQDPALDICVLERATFPVPEAAHKVGESTVELAAHYFAQTLGLEEHIQSRQLPKFGLRFFFGSGDVDSRLEVGGSDLPPTPSYQIDRGRFENFLVQKTRELGVEVKEGVKVHQISVSETEAPHSVTFLEKGVDVGVQGTWLIDASGRAALLKRELDLRKPSAHKASAVWFRVDESIRVDDWSDDPQWQAGHHGSRGRWYSTNHLMGSGYWVWLIPLASGSTSIGIVADESLHPVRDFSTLEKSLAWLVEHEPQCAQKVLSCRDRIQDFGVLKNYSHDCRRVFSSKRWFLTGEAGVFLDPFYSPGSDFIALGNNFITHLILEERRGGGDVRSKTRFFNNLYLSFFHNTLEIFQDQYPLFGHSQIMPLKIVWDQATYWALLAYLSIQGRLGDPSMVAAVGESVSRMGKANIFMQAAFRSYAQTCAPITVAGRIDFFSVSLLLELNQNLRASVDEARFPERLAQNAARLEQLASEMVAALDRFAGGSGDARYQDVAPSQELGDFLNRLGLAESERPVGSTA